MRDEKRIDISRPRLHSGRVKTVRELALLVGLLTSRFSHPFFRNTGVLPCSCDIKSPAPRGPQLRYQDLWTQYTVGYPPISRALRRLSAQWTFTIVGSRKS